MSEIGWIFPINDGGVDGGLNDAGVFTFRQDAVKSLARETGQNTGDAVVDKPAKIHFDLFYLPTEKFPDAQMFMEILQTCKEYREKDIKAQKFFTEAINLMNQTEIPILKVSDFNTSGLIGSNDDEESNWYKLVKSSGSTNKTSNTGGSYGIGKSALFSCSSLRTVFFGTYDLFHDIKFQGVTGLGTHRNKDGKKTQAIGYYGVKLDKVPMKDLSALDERFHRTEVGTDLFIAGYNELEDWDNRIAKLIIDSFYVAIDNGKLEVRVGEIEINARTLPQLVDKYSSEDRSFRGGCYFKALKNPEKIFVEENFQNMGRVVLHVVQDDAPKKVAMIRRTGMKIHDKEFRGIPFRFAGVLLAEGEDLNNLLKDLEPPSHDDWQPGMIDDRKERRRAGGILRELYSWVRDNVLSLVKVEASEEFDVEGMSEFLPDDIADSLVADDGDQPEGKLGPIKKVEVKVLPKKVLRPVPASGKEAATGSDDDAYGAVTSPGDTTNDETGGSGTTKPGGASKEDGTGASKPKQNGPVPSKVARPPGFRRVRQMHLDKTPGTYKLVVIPKSDGQGYLNIYIAGEDESEPAPIKSAIDEGTGQRIKIKNEGKIGPIQFEGEEAKYLLLTLDEPYRLALEVTASAD